MCRPPEVCALVSCSKQQINVLLQSEWMMEGLAHLLSLISTSLQGQTLHFGNLGSKDIFNPSIIL